MDFMNRWKNANGKFKIQAIVAMVFGGIVLAVVLAFVLGWVVMLLWNWLMPEIFQLPRIGYWQAWGLVLLSHILLKSGHAAGNQHGRPGTWKGRYHDRTGMAGPCGDAETGASPDEQA